MIWAGVPVLAHLTDEKLGAGEFFPWRAHSIRADFFLEDEGFKRAKASHRSSRPNEVAASSPHVESNACDPGLRVVHPGGKYASHLLVPRIPFGGVGPGDQFAPWQFLLSLRTCEGLFREGRSCPTS